MATFPRLKSGAVMQYPGTRGVKFATQVVRFVDGGEQRYRNYSAPLKTWEIRLELLDEGELTELEEFFRENQGQAASFSFTDPWSGTECPDCSVDQDTFALVLGGEMRGATSLVVRENRS
jgi:hypothetical protein